MLPQFKQAISYFAIIGLVQSVSASPVLSNRGIFDTDLDLGTISLGARVLVGDPTCPAVNGPDIHARVFAAVTLDEKVNVKAKISALNLVNVNVKAKLRASVKVCLCVRASVATNLLEIPANVNVQALADIKAAGRLQSNVNLGLALDALGAEIDLDLSPVSSSPCSCPANARPTCAGGQCGCEQCPADHVYDPTTGDCIISCPATTFPNCSSPSHCQCLPCPTGASFDSVRGVCVCAPGTVINEEGTTCIISPSGLPSQDRKKKRSYVNIPAYGKRQATRDDIVNRLQQREAAI